MAGSAGFAVFMDLPDIKTNEFGAQTAKQDIVLTNSNGNLISSTIFILRSARGSALRN